MNWFGETLHRLEIHRDLAYSLIRIYLGIALFVRGWLSLSDPSAITTLADGHNVYWWYSYIISAHLAGGILLALGLLTRLAALLQMPILVGAIVFIHLEQGLMTVGQSLELASLVLALLVILTLFGSGPVSLDSRIARVKAESSLVTG